MRTMDGYVRVSRVMGREGDGYMSPAIQEAEIRRWADRNGVTVGMLLTDEDVSGGKAAADRRLGELLKRVESGASDGVVVRSLDRFGRDSLDGAVNIKRLTDAGARLIAVIDNVDTGPGGSSKIALAVQLAIAEDYLDRVKANWDATKRRNVEERGLHVCGQAPFGYRRADAAEGYEGQRDARLVLEPSEAEIVRAAFEMRAEGQPFANVHRAMEARAGRGFNANTPTRMVKNRAYLGEARATVKSRDGHGTEQIVKEDAHEAIVTPELFAAAQREPRLPNDGTLAQQALLAGVVSCATCGSRMHVKGRGPKGRRRAFYACANEDCSARAAIVAERVDDHVVWLLSQDESGAADAAGSEEERWLAARERVRTAEADLAALVSERGDLKVETWRSMIVATEQALEAARAELYSLKDPGLADALVVMLDGKLRAYQPWGEDRDADRHTLRRYIGSVAVAPCGRGRGVPASERVAVRWIDGSAPKIASVEKLLASNAV
jgi:site-specific DNA recombinase